MMSYTIKSTQPETLNTIIIMLKAWYANQGRLGATQEELFLEALERLEFLQELPHETYKYKRGNV